jgi:hypothetical protein
MGASVEHRKRFFYFPIAFPGIGKTPMLSGPTQNLQKAIFYQLVITGCNKPCHKGKFRVAWKEGGSSEG